MYSELTDDGLALYGISTLDNDVYWLYFRDVVLEDLDKSCKDKKTKMGVLHEIDQTEKLFN